MPMSPMRPDPQPSMFSQMRLPIDQIMDLCDEHTVLEQPEGVVDLRFARARPWHQTLVAT